LFNLPDSWRWRIRGSDELIVASGIIYDQLEYRKPQITIMLIENEVVIFDTLTDSASMNNFQFQAGSACGLEWLFCSPIIDSQGKHL